MFGMNPSRFLLLLFYNCTINTSRGVQDASVMMLEMKKATRMARYLNEKHIFRFSHEVGHRGTRGGGDAGEDMRDPSRNKAAINGKTVCH